MRIAHESVLAATLKVAREKMSGVSTGPPAYPDLTYDEPLDWEDLVRQGLVTRHRVSNAEINAEFAGTIFRKQETIPTAPSSIFGLWT